MSKNKGWVRNGKMGWIRNGKSEVKGSGTIMFLPSVIDPTTKLCAATLM